VNINQLLNSTLIEIYLNYMNIEKVTKTYDLMDYKFNFRCPICNEGSSKTKKRGFVYKHRGTWFFNCFNGCPARPFEAFVRDVSPSTYSTMLDDLLTNGHRDEGYKTFTEKQVKENTPIEEIVHGEEILGFCDKIEKLPADHMVVQYIQKRKLPLTFEMYYTNQIYKIQEYIGMDSPYKDTLDYLIVVFRDVDGRINYVQGRDLTGKLSSRFKTLKVNKEIESLKVWGMNYIKFKPTRIFITEGAFDAMMIKENALAMGGSSADASEIEKKFCSGYTTPFRKSDLTFVFDNEKNEPTFKKMLSALKRGYSIVIWENSINYKDTNEMICKDLFTVDSLYTYLTSHTFQGKDALAKLIYWKHSYRDLIVRELK